MTSNLILLAPKMALEQRQPTAELKQQFTDDELKLFTTALDCTFQPYSDNPYSFDVWITAKPLQLKNTNIGNLLELDVISRKPIDILPAVGEPFNSYELNGYGEDFISNELDDDGDNFISNEV